MRNTFLALLVVSLASCASDSARAGLFEPCMVDEDCDPRWSCVPGISGPGGPRFCSEECGGGSECGFVRDGEREANFCNPYPGEEYDGACFATCPDEGGSPEDGCEAYDTTSRRYLNGFGGEQCACSP